MSTRNVTLTLPDDLLRRLKIIAAQRDSSISAMLVQALQELAEDETGFADARRGMLRDLKKGYDLGTNGKIGWSRDAIHERERVRRH